MKVCFISHSARLGGAEMVLLETIEVLQESGAGCYTMLPARGPLLAELEKLGVPTAVTPYALWVSRDRLSLLRRARALMNIALNSLLVAWQAWRWDCDIIYSNTSTVCVGAFAAALLGRPHVWHIHEFTSRIGLHFIIGEKWAHQLMNHMSSLVITPSHALADEFSNSGQGSRPRVVYCSLHRRPRDNGHACVHNRRYRCVITGPLTKNKRQEDAILALLELRQRGIEAELLLIGEGDGDYDQRLRRLVAQHHLQDRVSFLGRLEDPTPHLSDADVALVCSAAEGFGRVTVEAMLAGKPVIGADNTATAELIRDGANGLLYGTADPKDLASKIDYLYRCPNVSRRLASNAQVWANRVFTRDRYRDQLLPLLNNLLPPAACPSAI